MTYRIFQRNIFENGHITPEVEVAVASSPKAALKRMAELYELARRPHCRGVTAVFSCSDLPTPKNDDCPF